MQNRVFGGLQCACTGAIQHALCKGFGSVARAGMPIILRARPLTMRSSMHAGNSLFVAWLHCLVHNFACSRLRVTATATLCFELHCTAYMCADEMDITEINQGRSMQ